MQILSAQQYNSRLKATVQKTGKMSLSPETATALSLNPKNGVKFFLDGEPAQLYLAIMPEADAEAFTVQKSGVYYNVAAQLLFDELGIDYKTYTVIFDLVRCKAYDEEIGGVCYKLNQRNIKKKMQDEDIEL